MLINKSTRHKTLAIRCSPHYERFRSAGRPPLAVKQQQRPRCKHAAHQTLCVFGWGGVRVRGVRREAVALSSTAESSKAAAGGRNLEAAAPAGSAPFAPLGLRRTFVSLVEGTCGW